MAAIGLGLCLAVCALSVGILASMNGFFVMSDGNDPAVYADPDSLDYKTNEPQVYANPDILPHRTNTPDGWAITDGFGDYSSKYAELGEIPVDIAKFPRLIP